MVLRRLYNLFKFDVKNSDRVVYYKEEIEPRIKEGDIEDAVRLPKKGAKELTKNTMSRYTPGDIAGEAMRRAVKTGSSLVSLGERQEDPEKLRKAILFLEASEGFFQEYAVEKNHFFEDRQEARELAQKAERKLEEAERILNQ